MTKSDYLAQADVKNFIDWFAHHLSGASGLSHRYAMPGNRKFEFANLAQALARYEWGFPALAGVTPTGSNLAANSAALAHLQDRLRTAVAHGTDEEVRDAAIAVMGWGGVMNGNAKWLRENKDGLAALVRKVVQTLQQDDDSAEQFGAGLRFNAGMTKVYSLLLENFIIYDSRVAASLAWFVKNWMHEMSIASIPATLNFPCMPAKEGANAQIRKSRNPGAGAGEFQKMNNHPTRHARWNLRASWIIEAALKAGPDTSFKNMRAVEAALFMWGYDLNGNSPWQDNAGQTDFKRAA